MKYELEESPGLVQSIRERTAGHLRFLPKKEGAEFAQPGDIRLAHALPDGTQRLVLVLRVRPELNYAQVCLLSNETEMLSDHDALLLRDEVGLPFDLMAELDLTAPIYLIQAGSLFGRLESEGKLSALRSASDGSLANIRPGLRGIPIRGPSDPRWVYKESELQVLQRLSSECMEDLLEGKTIPRTVIDPALLHQVTSALPQDPDGCLERLLSIAELCQGGAAPEAAVNHLCKNIGKHLDVNPDIQLALQPLLECSLFPRDLASQDFLSISFFPARKPNLTAAEGDFHQILAELASSGGGRLIRLLTARGYWDSEIRRDIPLTIQFPGLKPLYAETSELMR